jgi:hypothetical protein
LVFVLNINTILLNQCLKKTAIKTTKMITKNLKTLQAICGSIMTISLIMYLYMDWKLDYEGLYYKLAKGIFQVFLALTWHFGMLSLKITKSEKYKPTLHKVLVGIWGFMGIIQVIDFFLLLF